MKKAKIVAHGSYYPTNSMKTWHSHPHQEGMNKGTKVDQTFVENLTHEPGDDNHEDRDMGLHHHGIGLAQRDKGFAPKCI